MPTYRRFKATPEAVAIYDVETREAHLDNEPFDDPLSHVEKLHFHSSLRYPGIVQTLTGTLNLAAVAAQAQSDVTYQIAAHGLSGVPYVEGVIYISGQWVTMAGSVPVDQDSGDTNAGSFIRWLNLGANETHILFHDYAVTHSSFGGFAAQDIPYKIYVTDYLMT